ncbi:radical SAM protein [Megamonas funiformis]|uniref:radical SAM protein n=1 Tax=Megamonas funiformis TaxID=437897 RepID=UPI00224E17E7|nr:radical SAM protein [Megamonas funiformis]MCX4131383.1 radical SAM protein [Megamonas funiformis]
MKRFLDCYIPITTCNLKCHYCYIAQLNNFENEPPKFKYDNEYIAKALSKDRLGGICLINLCANGETLLVPRMVELIKLLLENGHYISVVTNGTITKHFDEIVKFPRVLLERLFFKFSFHYLELKRLNKMDEFFRNIDKIRSAGCSFTLELTPSDEIIPYIDDIIALSKEKVGAICHVTIARKDFDPQIGILSKYSIEDYKKIWEKFNSPLFEFKLPYYYKKRKEFCYAGEWSLILNIGTGDINQCHGGCSLGNIYEDINKPIKFLPIGCNCKMPHCFNAHSFLSFGDIPELDTPTQYILRNRVCDDGSEWLTPTFKKFFSEKLIDNNKEYSKEEQNKINRKNKIMFIKQKISPKRIINFIGRKLK